MDHIKIGLFLLCFFGNGWLNLPSVQASENLAAQALEIKFKIQDELKKLNISPIPFHEWIKSDYVRRSKSYAGFFSQSNQTEESYSSEKWVFSDGDIYLVPAYANIENLTQFNRDLSRFQNSKDNYTLCFITRRMLAENQLLLREAAAVNKVLFKVQNQLIPELNAVVRAIERQSVQSSDAPATQKLQKETAPIIAWAKTTWVIAQEYYAIGKYKIAYYHDFHLLQQTQRIYFAKFAAGWINTQQCANNDDYQSDINFARKRVRTFDDNNQRGVFDYADFGAVELLKPLFRIY